MSIIQATNIDKTYGLHKALDNVSIEIPESSIYGLLGPNGAGKTTFIRIINQIIAPDKGEVLFMGRKLNPNDIAHIGYLPEERGLYKKMKVGEHAIYLARLKGLDQSQAIKQIRYWFAKFEMQKWWDKKVEELSKGMQQKLQFVCTVLHEPQLLIFDEPFSGFDPINAQLLKDEILELKQKGATIVFSTHNMATVEDLCDYISLIDKSKVVLNGSVANIKQSFKNGLFEIGFSGNPSDFETSIHKSFEIIEIKKEHDNYIASVRSNKMTGNNELLKSLFDKIHVTSYREILPSMNEIFIKAVNNKN